MQGSPPNPDPSSSSSSSRAQPASTPTTGYLSHNPYSTLVSPHYASGYPYLGQHPANANQSFWSQSYAAPQGYYPYQPHPSGHVGTPLASGSGIESAGTQSGNAPHQHPPSVPPQSQQPQSLPTPTPPIQASTTPAPAKPSEDTLKPVCTHWDAALKAFLEKIKFRETLRGFENDFLVLNDGWEREVVFDALVGLVEGLQAVISRARGDEGGGEDEDMVVDVESKPPPGDGSSLDERKLEYVHLVNSASKPRTPSSVNKEISRFIARTRARNNASNRREFLYSLAEKKQRRREELAALDAQQVDMRGADHDEEEDEDIPSCARADAKPIDRDAQMKYDIAKNEDGPLARTMVQAGKMAKGKGKEQESGSSSLPRDREGSEEDRATADRYPALTERIQNIEDHVAVRYVPSLPRTLFARVKFLEDHLIKLEKEYPPWAALHFNQPHRGWPPPPKATPIIVPPHLRAPVRQSHGLETTGDMQNQLNGETGVSTVTSSNVPDAPSAVGTGTGARGKSSLYQAVMEKLEVQKAMSDLKQRENSN